MQYLENKTVLRIQRDQTLPSFRRKTDSLKDAAPELTIATGRNVRCYENNGLAPHVD
jgi:hypothetical protein